MNAKEYIRKFRRARRIARIRSLRREAQRHINIMEFAGTVYVSIGGTPVVDVGNTVGSTETVLEDARDTWVRHMLWREEDGL